MMKKIYVFLFAAVTLLTSYTVGAQSFTRSNTSDTVHLIYSGSGNQDVHDNLACASTGTVTLKWSVVSCNFPSDWLSNGNPGICDANTCYSFGGTNGLWPAATVETVSYGHTAGDYHLQITLVGGTSNATTTGTYYCTARIYNQFASTSADTAYTTFAVTWMPTGIPNVGKSGEDVLLYPNPAGDEINVVYDADADVKTIAVYNVIGRVMSVYKVNGNSANLNLENIPAGIYFARLANSKGEVVVTRKFTKQ